jgi:hypothetical protein
MHPARNRRSLDPFLRGRIRLSYKVRLSHTAFVQAQLQCALAALHSTDCSRNACAKRVL